MSWHYEKAPLNGGAPGDAYKSVFNGSGKNEAANLAREAIQNSVDAAADPGGSVRVDFRFRRVQDGERRAFETATSLTDIALRVVVGGVLVPGKTDAADGDFYTAGVNDMLGDGVNVDDVGYRTSFPYLGSALSGRDHAHHGTTPVANTLKLGQ